MKPNASFRRDFLPFPTIPAWSSVGDPFSETGRESAPPVALYEQKCIEKEKMKIKFMPKLFYTKFVKEKAKIE